MGQDERDTFRQSSPPMATPDESLFTGPLGEIDDHAEVAPHQFGRFLVKRIIGRGGMGIVYLAEQTEPFHREVALKFIRRGSFGKSVIKRFNLERQVHAVMNHENIARVFDADETQDGQPYFVMEYVDGQRLDRFAADGQLSVRQRLQLILQVCDAVQHAHQKGIIHRDLKPSNILVTRVDNRTVPKVIDFGVVKPLDSSLSDESLHTEDGRLMGTPQYMSPEQLSMGKEDVDTRADVYSLGVLLYELLTGVLPFEDQWENAFQYVINVRKMDPVLASVRLKGLKQSELDDIAQQRRTHGDDLVRTLTRDLDWILMKALARDRDERYPTVANLADDISRYLGNQPISVGKPTYAYVMSKFVRRHKWGVAVAAIFFLVLCAGTVGTSYGMWQARKAEREAMTQRELALESLALAEESERRVQAVNRFMTRMLSSADPEHEGREVRVADVLGLAAKEAGVDFADDAAVECAVRRAIGQTFIGLGKPELAKEQIELALDRARAELGADHPETMAALEDLAAVHFHRGRYQDSERVYREIIAHHERRHPKNETAIIDITNNLALTLKFQDRFHEAIPLYRGALQYRVEHFGEDDDRTIESMNNLAMALKGPAQRQEAESLMRRVFEMVRVTKGEDHPWTLTTLNNLAYLLRDRGDVYEAIVFHRETLNRRQRVLGEEHPHTLQSMDALAQCLVMVDELEAAESLAKRAYEGFVAVNRADHPNTLKTATVLAGIYTDRAQAQAGLDLLDLHREAIMAEFGADSFIHQQLLMHRVAAYLVLGDRAQAELALAEVEQITADSGSWSESAISGYRAALDLTFSSGDDPLERILAAIQELEVFRLGSEVHYLRFVRIAAQALRDRHREGDGTALVDRAHRRWPEARTDSASIRSI